MPVSFAIELHDGLVDGLIEVFRSRESLVGEVMTLQVAPEFFNIVELRAYFGSHSTLMGLSQTRGVYPVPGRLTV